MSGKTLTVRLGLDLHEQLKLVAHFNGSSMTAEVQAAIAQYVAAQRRRQPPAETLTTVRDADRDTRPMDRRWAVYLIRELGPTLLATLTGVTDRELPKRWALGQEEVHRDARVRLECGYRAFRLICDADGPDVARSWMVGANPRLGDEAPVIRIREGRFQEVLGADHDDARDEGGA